MGVLSESRGVGTSLTSSWIVGETLGATFVGVFWV